MLLLSLLGGTNRFPGFCGNQHIQDPTRSQNPFLNRLRNGSRSCFVGFRCFETLHVPYVPFILRSFACMFLHVPFICMHIPSILHSFPVIFLSCFFHLYSFSYSCHIFQCAFMSFHVLSSSFHLPFNLHACPFHFASCPFIWFSKVMEMALRLGQGTECNKWLSLGDRYGYR